MKRLKHYIRDNQSLMRAIILLILTPMLMFHVGLMGLAEVQPALSSDDSDNNADTYPHITALENAILGQSFPGQPITDRLSRMEKKAFGKISTKLDLSDRTDALDDYSEKQLHKRLRSNADDETTNSSVDQPIENQADYPHVTALEQAILGQTFAGQPLADRLSRMEVKAFGKVSTKSDLSDRTDALDDYTYNQLHKNLLQANANGDTTNSAESESVQNQADYPHVTALEQAILGQTYVGQPLADRLSRMEIKAFGSASTNPDLGERTDVLDRYAQKKLHKQTLKQPAGTDTAIDSAPQGGGLLSKMEQAIVGMAGGGIGGGPGMIGGPGTGFGGMGFPGMGNGFSGMGGGGGGMRRRQAAQQQQNEAPAPVRQEDQAVYLAAPPDPSARLIVKVGWCEVKIFGHTFPTMHLPERLGQLNKELNLEPGKSDVQLMDDIGLMIKAVQARKPLGPTSQPKVSP